MHFHLQLGLQPVVKILVVVCVVVAMVISILRWMVVVAVPRLRHTLVQVGAWVGLMAGVRR